MLSAFGSSLVHTVTPSLSLCQLTTFARSLFKLSLRLHFSFSMKTPLLFESCCVRCCRVCTCHNSTDLSISFKKFLFKTESEPGQKCIIFVLSWTRNQCRTLRTDNLALTSEHYWKTKHKSKQQKMLQWTEKKQGTENDLRSDERHAKHLICNLTRTWGDPEMLDVENWGEDNRESLSSCQVIHKLAEEDKFQLCRLDWNQSVIAL